MCWAHLIRHFIQISERKGLAGEIGQRLLLLSHVVIRIHHRYAHDAEKQGIYQRRMRGLLQQRPVKKLTNKNPKLLSSGWMKAIPISNKKHKMRMLKFIGVMKRGFPVRIIIHGAMRPLEKRLLEN